MAKRISGPTQSSSSGFDRELAELGVLAEALRAEPAPTAAHLAYLRKMLAHRNNFLVSKAAALVADHELFALVPDVVAAYERFFHDAVKSDPHCWAKNALSKAMVKLEFQEAAPYIRGLRHHQLEPVWGGQSDTAGALRGTCAHALVACPGLSNSELLDLLIESLVDSDVTVRTEAARAIGHVGGAGAGHILKLRLLVAKEEPEVMGAIFAGLLAIDPRTAIPLVARSLDDTEEMAAEAALALAATHAVAALDALLVRRRKPNGPWLASVLDNAIALTRLPEGMRFLLDLIAQDDRTAPSALEAISRVNTSAEVREQAQTAVAESGNDRLESLFQELFFS